MFTNILWKTNVFSNNPNNSITFQFLPPEKKNI